MLRKQTGFTLIELLIVIAIIGILALIIFSALSGARGKGSDSSIKAELDQARTEMEISGLSGSDYGPNYVSTNCPTSSSPPDSLFYTDPNMKNIISSLNATNGDRTICAAGTPSASGNATSWAIASPVKGSVQWWCVSSSNGPKLSIRGENFFIKFLQSIIPAANASPFPPNLGGGNGAPAICP